MPHLQPMIVSIWCGRSKPNNLTEYLRQFVDELNDMLEHGIIVNGHKIAIRCRCFICDSPARAFLKGTIIIFFKISNRIFNFYLLKRNLKFQWKVWMSKMYVNWRVFSRV